MRTPQSAATSCMLHAVHLMLYKYVLLLCVYNNLSVFDTSMTSQQELLKDSFTSLSKKNKSMKIILKSNNL